GPSSYKITIDFDYLYNDDFYTYEKEFKGIMPKKANKSKKVSYLSDADVSKLLDFINNNLEGERHYAYIHALGIKLMLFAGLRVSEVLALTLDNIQISDLRNSENEQDFYEVHLQDTKSKEEQTALIKREHIEKELAYFKLINRDNEFIFKAKNNKNPINRSNFYVSITKIMQDLNIKRKGLHVLRHTCAMQLFRKTGNLLVLKETLRHSDIKTTMSNKYNPKEVEDKYYALCEDRGYFEIYIAVCITLYFWAYSFLNDL
ncbi:MAG TPA: hypothetical protein EYP03_04220, partial [Aquificae bacterium]|nr:hypothetical protein [Aquificota bacterium]